MGVLPVDDFLIPRQWDQVTHLSNKSLTLLFEISLITKIHSLETRNIHLQLRVANMADPNQDNSHLCIVGKIS